MGLGNSGCYVVAGSIGIVVLISLTYSIGMKVGSVPGPQNPYVGKWVPIMSDPDIDAAMLEAFNHMPNSVASPPMKLLIEPRVDSDLYSDGFSNRHMRDDDLVANAFSDVMKQAIPISIGESILNAIVIISVALALIKCLTQAGNALAVRWQDTRDDHGDSILPLLASTNNLEVATPLSISVAQVPEKGSMERFFSNMAREKPIRFSAQQLSDFTSNYATRLGSGGYGVVYRGELLNGVSVAVKVLTGRISDKQMEEQFMAEVSTIGRTYHINLVRLYGFCFDNTVRALVYEFIENGSLAELLFDKNQTVGVEKLLEIAIGTAKGLAYLHEGCQQRIIHYDIKPENILLDANLTPKVADFGLARLCSRDRTHVSMSGFRGTPGYAAPEIWNPFPVTHMCDVYSFGMLMFEIVGRRRNVESGRPESQEWFPRWVMEKFERGEVTEMARLYEIEDENGETAERMCKVALWCVQRLPESRPFMSNVVKMLEGGVEIPSPPNPFLHLMSSGVELSGSENLDPTTDSSGTVAEDSSYEKARENNNDVSANKTREESVAERTRGTDKIWDGVSTPTMKKYEIEMAF